MIAKDWFGAPGKAHVVTAGAHELRYAEVLPGLFCTTMRGHLTYDIGAQLVAAVEPLLRRGPTRIFHHWWDMTGYDPQARAILVEVALKHKANMQETHLLVQSPLVVMAVKAANLVLRGGLEAHDALPQFLEAFERAKRSTQ